VGGKTVCMAAEFCTGDDSSSTGVLHLACTARVHAEARSFTGVLESMLP
jgi:hypothetical protein